MNERVNPSVARPVYRSARASRRGVSASISAPRSAASICAASSRTRSSRRSRTALVENELIIFRNQDITSEQLMDFGRRFGELTVHPFAPNEGKNAPELIKFRNDETTPPFGTDVWHSDETFRAEPPMATILCAKETPAVGGDTMFASMSAAYDGLSDRMQQLISGLYAIHDMKPFRPLFGQSLEERKKLQHFELQYPPQLHPVVRIHPVSGRKVLFVNPQFTLGIDGMEETRKPRAARHAVPAGAGSGISVPPSLGAAHHRDVGQPLDPALRGARLLSAAPLHGARDHPRRPGHRRRARGSGNRAARQIRGAEGRRHPRRPQTALGRKCTSCGGKRMASRLGYSILCVGSMAIALSFLHTSYAQPADTIDRPVVIYVAGTVGGGIDLYARLVGRHLGRHIPGSPTVTVQDMPGAGGIRAAAFLATAAPRDGTAITTFAGGPVLEPLIAGRFPGYNMS